MPKFPSISNVSLYLEEQDFQIPKFHRKDVPKFHFFPGLVNATFKDVMWSNLTSFDTKP